jgi:hypothetical protein
VRLTFEFARMSKLLAKNSSSPTGNYECVVVKSSGVGAEKTIEIDCHCTDPADDTNLLDPANYVDPVPAKPQKVIKKIIQGLVEARNKQNVVQATNGPRMRIKVAGPASRNGRHVPAWIDLVNGVFIYKFNVFNNDPTRVDQTKLQSIFNAIKKDGDTNLAADYGKSVDFKLYKAADMARPELFQGDRMAIFVGPYSNGMFHYVNTPEPANTYSFPVGGGSLAPYKIKLPTGSKFDYVPYSIISSDNVEDFYGSPANIYAISPTTVPKDTFHQIIAMASGHEVKEILGNDSTLNWVLFDHFASTVAGWHWGEFGKNDDANACTNGVVNKTTKYVELPLFLKQFPSGGLLFAVREVGDVVSAGVCGLLNSYLVDGWLMANYPLQTFWEPYNDTANVQYDKLGFVKHPLEPYGGLHQLVFFVSFDDAKVRMLEVQNKGPVTQVMRGAPAANNFPPDYVYARLIQEIVPNHNVVELIASLENYGPSKPDRT